ncbi:MAG: hypothetical protein AMJ79_01020 [Phycisphaerae bacterium SM23_30]|nr:MAG: hypothetical protein AMJ79_01020 [Phycisphaerae bacterium SM23_30]
MEWLAPMTAIYAASVAVPLLVLMYFLKLKRQERLISSTLLWRRAVRDLQVNAPLQRLRRNLLLLLQLLALLSILAALGRPILSLQAGAGQRYVLLIDNSASMNAADAGPARLEEAQRQARLFVESLRNKTSFSLGEASDQAMVIAFNNHAQVMCNFTADKHQLTSAIESISPGDGGSSLYEAVTVARAFAQSPGTENNDRSAEEMPQLVLFSDGRIGDAEQLVINAEEIDFHCIGNLHDNIAITAMQARRSYENADEVTVFATLANYGFEAVNCAVQLSLNGDVRAVRPVDIPARRTSQAPGLGSASEVEGPGTTSVTFVLEYAEAGVIELRQLHPDLLNSDDAAWSILPPPKRLSVLLVTQGNLALESALEACPLARLVMVTPDEFNPADQSENSLAAALSADQLYDVIVLDNHAPAELPRGRYIVFGRPPPDIGVSVTEELQNQVMVDWRSRHPVLQYVNLANFFTAKGYKMDLPRDAEVLGELNESPALALLHRRGSVFVLVGFDVMDTNWPFEAGFVMFFYNATAFLSREAGPGRQNFLQVGEAIILEGADSGTEAQIEGPVYFNEKIETQHLGSLRADPAGTIRFAGTDRVGLYNVIIEGKAPEFFAVNLLDAYESDVKPVDELFFSGQQVKAEQAPVRRTNVELWPYLVLLALVMACVEWLVYNSRVRL